MSPRQLNVLSRPFRPFRARLHLLIACLLALGFLVPVAATAQDRPRPDRPAANADADNGAKPDGPASGIPASWVEALSMRCIGPANMSGRIVDLAVDPQRPHRFWAATASGGLIYTENGGASFTHQFDDQATVSIGAIALAPTDSNLLWVGTGECNPRNSVSWGNGVYKSTDAGKTFTHMGLDKTFQIGAIVIHPVNPDIVYVGAMGRCWGPNEERGLYRTVDGGKTWERILFVNDQTGVIDIQMDPNDSETLLVATWQRQRDEFCENDPALRFAEGGGLWKTTDGGKTFRRVTAGLPTNNLGRLAMSYSESKPGTVFALVDCELIGTYPANSPYVGVSGTDAEVGARLTAVTEDHPAAQAGLKVGDIIVTIDGDVVHSYREFVKIVRQHVAGDKLQVEVSRNREKVVVELTLGERPKPEGEEGEDAEGADDPDARRRGSPFATRLDGQRPNMQDEQGPDGHEFGGTYRSDDGGETWVRVNSHNPRPMYFSQIEVDPTNVDVIWTAGVALWRSEDGGKTFKEAEARGVHVDHHAIWINPADSNHVILGNDGGVYVTHDRGQHWDHLNTVAIGQFYHVGVGPRRDYMVYGGLQDNGSWGGPSVVRNDGGPINTDWFRVGGGDGFRCLVDPEDPDLIYSESQNGYLGQRHLGTGESGSARPRAPRGTEYRFNWYTPYILSAHNSKIVYVAGNRVFRSLRKGEGMRAISPEISATDRGSATSLAESPRDPDLLYVGTDDGAVWRSRDGGRTWENLRDLPAPEPKEEAGDGDTTGSPDGDGGDGADGEGDGGEEGSDTGDAEGDEAGGDQAPQTSPGLTDEEKVWRERLMGRDANGDEQLSEDEIPGQFRDQMGEVDTNGDGIIAGEEIIGAVRLLMRLIRERQAGGDTPGRGRGGRDEDAPDDDGGKSLKEIAPDLRYVSWIEASRVRTGRVYLVLDGHRSDDDRAMVFVSENRGTTWHSLVGDLPASAGTTRTFAEDRVNPDLQYLGTEFGAYFSIDRGQHWVRFANLPTVAVHAFAQPAQADELVLGTHGRSIWICDVKALRQFNKETLGADVHLFDPAAAVMWRSKPGRGDARSFSGTNPPDGARIAYSLKKKANEVTIEIQSVAGETVRTLDLGDKATDAGLHVTNWNLRRLVRARNGSMREGPRVQPGSYRVVLTVNGTAHTRELVVTGDPAYPSNDWIAFANAREEAEYRRQLEELAQEPTIRD